MINMNEIKLIKSDNRQYKLFFENNSYILFEDDYQKIYNFIKKCKEESTITEIDEKYLND